MVTPSQNRPLGELLVIFPLARRWLLLTPAGSTTFRQPERAAKSGIRFLLKARSALENDHVSEIGPKPDLGVVSPFGPRR